jgi:hypothetical protein
MYGAIRLLPTRRLHRVLFRFIRPTYIHTYIPWIHNFVTRQEDVE